MGMANIHTGVFNRQVTLAKVVMHLNHTESQLLVFE